MQIYVEGKSYRALIHKIFAAAVLVEGVNESSKAAAAAAQVGVDHEVAMS